MEITDLLIATQKNKASDLHIATKNPPIMRVNGDMLPLDVPALSGDEVKRMLYSVMSDQQRSDYEQELELDFSISFAADTRFRVNTFNTINGPAAVFRTIPTKIMTLETLARQMLLSGCATYTRGLSCLRAPRVLVSRPRLLPWSITSTITLTNTFSRWKIR